MNLEIFNLIFFAFRLGPFLLISFFILNSFFQQDIKCIIFIVGIVIACFLGILTGNSLSIFEFPPALKETDSLCHIITLGESGPLSKIPLSTLIYSYTAMYLAYPIYPSLFDSTKRSETGKVTEKNPNISMYSDLPLFFLFSFLIVVDALWMIQYHCFNTYSIITGAIIGLCVGMAWSYIVGSSGKSPYHYFGILVCYHFD